MKTRFVSTVVLIILAVSLAACGIRTAVPGFKYPVYDPDTPWPTLAPTATLEKASNIDVEAEVKEVERLKRLAN